MFTVRPRTFPEGFIWGTATSGHQIEGNNTASDWWAWESGKIRGGRTSGLACDAWNRYEEDYDIMASLGLNGYRMGIEWARVQPSRGSGSSPDGGSTGWDDAAFARYEHMLQALASRGIRVCLTLYHWTLPKWVADDGGWENPATVDRFAAYVEQVVERLGRYPHLWCTLNEPNVYTMSSYVAGEFPPEVRSFIRARRVMRNLWTAHAAAWQIINSAHTGPGKPLVGIAHNMMEIAPASQGLLDRKIAQFHSYAWNRSFIDALETGTMRGPFGDGKPIPGLAGSYSCLGVNYYLRRTVKFALNGIADAFSQEVIPEGTDVTDFGWPVVPEGLTYCLNQAASLRVPIYIMENGLSDARDALRPRFILEHLEATARAMESGADVRGYFHWSFQDNFEWRDGYTQKFGLVELDPEHPEAPRRPRPSAQLYSAIARANGITDEMIREWLC